MPTANWQIALAPRRLYLYLGPSQPVRPYTSSKHRGKRKFFDPYGSTTALEFAVPRSSPTICSSPGCGSLTITGRCDRHQVEASRDHKAETAYRGSASSRGYDWQWQKLSKRLRRERPLCEMYCKDEGKATAATLVDHIVPADVRPDLRLAESNLQCGCDSCNSRKRFEDDAMYREVRRKSKGEGGV